MIGGSLFFHDVTAFHSAIHSLSAQRLSGIPCRRRRSVGAQRCCARPSIRFHPPYREPMIQIGAKGWACRPPARILHESTVPMIQIGAKGWERGPPARILPEDW